MYEQTTLFNLEPRVNYKVSDEKSKFVGWSYSRRNLFETCLLQYYYQYYGSSKKLSPDEPFKDRLHFLKSLRSVHLRAGEIAHLVIRTYLIKHKQEPSMRSRGIDNWASQIFRNDFEYSLEFQKDPSIGPKNRAVLLSEFFHNPGEASDIWEQANLDLRAAVSNFLSSPSIERFRLGAMDASSIIEEKLNMKFGQKNITGQIDLAFQDMEGTHVVDWKTGLPNGGDDSLQLFSYAMLVANKFGVAPETISIYKVYLQTEDVSVAHVNKREILRAKGRILQDTDRMQSMERYGRAAITEAFTPCDQPLICQMCPFSTVCPSFNGRRDR